MAVTFLEPGGDADFAVASTNGFWSLVNGGSVSTATDFVHGNHQKSIQYGTGTLRRTGVLQDAGTRISIYVYINTFPSGTGAKNLFAAVNNASGNEIVRVTIMKTTNVLNLFDRNNKLGTDGPALSTGQWYRISLAYTITSTTVNRFELFVDGVSAISITNATILETGATRLDVGNRTADAALDLRTSDHYADNSSSLTDPGDIWVTAKRPNANGTTNGFTTQIGSGGSGYGTGHAPQVNERPLSTTNGWSMVGAGSAVTEEYSIESASTGDIDISAYTIVDFLGWVSANSLSSETASIIVAGSSSNISLTSTTTLFTKVAGSTTYPAGNTDIGITTTTALTTVSLYECGIIVAAIPPIISTLSLSVSDSSTVTDTLQIQEIDFVDIENPMIAQLVIH